MRELVYEKESLKDITAEVMDDSVQNKLNENSARMNELNERLRQTLKEKLSGEIAISEIKSSHKFVASS